MPQKVELKDDEKQGAIVFAGLTGGFAIGTAISTTGFMLMAIGALLTITGIFSIIGIPLVVIGILMVMAGPIVWAILSSMGVAGAVAHHIAKKKKTDKK